MTIQTEKEFMSLPYRVYTVGQTKQDTIGVIPVESFKQRTDAIDRLQQLQENDKLWIITCNDVPMYFSSNISSQSDYEKFTKEIAEVEDEYCQRIASRIK